MEESDHETRCLQFFHLSIFHKIRWAEVSETSLQKQRKEPRFGIEPWLSCLKTTVSRHLEHTLILHSWGRSSISRWGW